ncbi:MULTISPECIES: SDR family NAD(P)-dependent oxidoreductase [Nocardiaceae]|uniref:SDR family NAD(P)-dependent oxidoreductase n=1 Tax=Nocardiaceae TaxID=85025 RepID=UPI0034393516
MKIQQTPATMLLTGATSGLGLEVARRMAGSTLWTVLATARSEEKIEQLKNALDRPSNFRYAICDQADFSSIRRAGADIAGLIADGAVPTMSSVLLNAGIQTSSTDRETTDGVELTFATNVAGPHLLLGLMSRHLGASAQIVQIGSGTHYGQFRRSYGMVAKPKWTSPKELSSPRHGDGIEAYSTSKLGTLYVTHELVRRAPLSVTPMCYDPGMLPGTGLARDRSAVERFVWRRLLPGMRLLPGVSSPAHSASHLARFATKTSQYPEDRLRGSYVEIDRPVPSSPESYDKEREKSLFEFLNDLTGLNAGLTAPWWFSEPAQARP